MRIYKVGDRYGIVRDRRNKLGKLIRVESLQEDGKWRQLTGGLPNGEAGRFTQLEAEFIEQTGPK